jgi:DNA primase
VAADEHESIVDFYTESVLPALTERLDRAFPEFGWRRDARGWVATNEETTHRALGVRAERVVAHGPAPRGLLVHGGDAMLWTAYVSGGVPPRGADFVRAVKEIAERAGVDTTAIERPIQRDRGADLLGAFAELCRRELASSRGRTARDYLIGRGLPSDAIEASGIGLVPAQAVAARALAAAGYSPPEIERSQVLGDSRWCGRLCGAWSDERGGVRTLWARPASRGAASASKYLYLRGAQRGDRPPYGWSDRTRRPPSSRRELLVVEGLLDVHHLRARGVENVVALGGTALSSRLLERLDRAGVEAVTLSFDRDRAGRSAASRAVAAAGRAARSPRIFVVEPELLAPAKDPDELVRMDGVERLRAAIADRQCGFRWQALELLNGVHPTSSVTHRRDALARAGTWLGSLPPRLALEQEDAVRGVASRCGYSVAAVERAFRARFWNAEVTTPDRRKATDLERSLS